MNKIIIQKRKDLENVTKIERSKKEKRNKAAQSGNYSNLFQRRPSSIEIKRQRKIDYRNALDGK